MRWCLGVTALLLLSGCASDPPAAPADVPAEPLPLAGAFADANATALPSLRFGDVDREAEMPIDVTFAPTDQCILGFPDCPTTPVDLTPIVPVDVPVELTIVLQVNGFVQATVYGNEEVSFVQYAETEDADAITIAALLVRGAAGTVTLEFRVIMPPFQEPGTAPTATGTAHTVSRADVVPAFVPVAATLAPGDVVEARGGGLEQLVVFPPTGEAIRDTTAPFSVNLSADAPAGTYLLFAEADEAVRMYGPNQTLVAHRLVHLMGAPVDVPMSQPTSWPFEVPGFPLVVGIVVESKQTVPDCCGAASYIGPRHVTITTPANVDVLVQEEDCLPFMGCPLNPVGYSWAEFQTDFLAEHLVPGTYTATVTLDQANNIQAYAWAVYIS